MVRKTHRMAFGAVVWRNQVIVVRLKGAAAALLFAVILTPVGVEAAASRLHVGNTGIRCVRMPCPGRAVFRPQPPEGAAARDRMLYVDVDGRTPPPPMVGRPADLTAVRRAWAEYGCLAIDGRLVSGDDRTELRIDRVLGSCRLP